MSELCQCAKCGSRKLVVSTTEEQICSYQNIQRGSGASLEYYEGPEGSRVLTLEVACLGCHAVGDETGWRVPNIQRMGVEPVPKEEE